MQLTSSWAGLHLLAKLLYQNDRFESCYTYLDLLHKFSYVVSLIYSFTKIVTFLLTKQKLLLWTYTLLVQFF